MLLPGSWIGNLFSTTSFYENKGTDNHVSWRHHPFCERHESVRIVHQELKSKGLRLRPLENEDGLACFDIRDPEKNRIQFWGKY